MPRPLPEPAEKVDWRIDSADLEYLRRRFPGRVNPIVREVIRVFVARLQKENPHGQT